MEVFGVYTSPTNTFYVYRLKRDSSGDLAWHYFGWTENPEVILSKFNTPGFELTDKERFLANHGSAEFHEEDLNNPIDLKG